MCHADLRREAAAVIAAKPTSVLLYGTAVWCLVPGMDVWPRVFCGGNDDAMGSKTVLTEQSYSYIQSDGRLCRLDV